MIKKDSIIMGKMKTTQIEKITNKPKKKFRILIQEKEVKGNGNEAMRSFMIYDFSGRATVDSIKNKLKGKLK